MTSTGLTLVNVGNWQRYVALGDSITEGLCDPVIGAGEPWLGWADRLAAILAGNARLRGAALEFANLAVRGRRVRDVVTDQVPRAIELRADLVSVLVGGNDLMAPKADPDAIASELETGIARLREAGADVLLATSFDPRFAFFLKPLRGRAAVFNANLWSIARRYGTIPLDLWGVRELQHRSMWAQDRVHLSPAGHRLVATRAAHALGVPYVEIARQTIPVSPSELAPPLTMPGWVRRHALPWVGRRLRRRSSGDGMPPKLPRPHPVFDDPALDDGSPEGQVAPRG